MSNELRKDWTLVKGRPKTKANTHSSPLLPSLGCDPKRGGIRPLTVSNGELEHNTTQKVVSDSASRDGCIAFIPTRLAR